MSEPRTCHLPTSTELFCIGVERLDQAEALQRHYPAVLVSNRTKPGDRR